MMSRRINLRDELTCQQHENQTEAGVFKLLKLDTILTREKETKRQREGENPTDKEPNANVHNMLKTVCSMSELGGL